MSTLHSSTRQPRKWTLAEDQKLREEVELQILDSGDVKDWCKIAVALPGRTNKDCRKRWHNSVAGGLNKGQWSKTEDLLLARGVQQHGQRWTLVANCVESRSADQCAKRWQQSLDPELDRSEWRDEEDKILIEATQQLGRHWKDIQREHFPGRSKNCIKNRYTVLVRRYQNQGITLPSRGSSPSEPSTPAPPGDYIHEDEYSSYASDAYGNLMPPQTHRASTSSRRSWSSMDGEALAWSSPQDYNIPLTTSPVGFNHTTSSMTGYGYSDLSPNVSITPADWTWSGTSMEPSSAMYATSPVAYTNTAHLAPQPYDTSGRTRPAMSSSISYSSSPARTTYSTMPNAATINVPRPRAWSDQQQYDSLSPTTYADPRLQQNPLYRF